MPYAQWVTKDAGYLMRTAKTLIRLRADESSPNSNPYCSYVHGSIMAAQSHHIPQRRLCDILPIQYEFSLNVWLSAEEYRKHITKEV